ncbi:hypothetical protein M1D88_05230 [Arthrobacter sp. R1-13]
MTGNGTASQGQRMFHKYRRWPLLPTGDLLKLQRCLRQSQDLYRPDASRDLLRIIDDELQLRAYCHDMEQQSDGCVGNN